jgi:hypothetical protein
MQAINAAVQPFREVGMVRFDRVFAVPGKLRLPAMLVYNEEKTYLSLTNVISVMLAEEGVNDMLAVRIAGAILNSAGEDNLSIQDVVLFLQDLKQGKYDKFFGAVTVIQFMEKFEQYRQARYEAIKNYRNEENVQNKTLYSRDVTEQKTTGERLRQDEIDSMINKIEKQYGAQL